MIRGGQSTLKVTRLSLIKSQSKKVAFVVVVVVVVIVIVFFVGLVGLVFVVVIVDH